VMRVEAMVVGARLVAETARVMAAMVVTAETVGKGRGREDGAAERAVVYTCSRR